MKYIIYAFMVIVLFGCKEKGNEVEEEVNSSNDISEDYYKADECIKLLYKIVQESSSLEKINVKSFMEYSEKRNDTLFFRVYTNKKTINEVKKSTVGWLVLPPLRDKLFRQVVNGDGELDELYLDQRLLRKFVECIEGNEYVEFYEMFNEGTLVQFGPKDLDKDDEKIREFKEKLRIFEKKHPNKAYFDINELSRLINNETFFAREYYVNSEWLQYFITKYEVNVYALNELMKEAISNEDYDAIVVLLSNGYIISDVELSIAKDTKRESLASIEENKIEYPYYEEEQSRIDDITKLFKRKYTTTKIVDPDGYTNLRKGEGTSKDIITQIKSGEYVKVLDNTNAWFFVETADGKIGYVHRSRVKSE